MNRESETGCMDRSKLTIPVFRTQSPQELSRATARLEEAGVPFDVHGVPGGGRYTFTRRTHTILVSAGNLDRAKEILSSVPSEFIPEWERIPRGGAKVKLSPLVVFIILAIAAIYVICVLVYG